jgi:hypothetical protein
MYATSGIFSLAGRSAVAPEAKTPPAFSQVQRLARTRKPREENSRRNSNCVCRISWGPGEGKCSTFFDDGGKLLRSSVLSRLQLFLVTALAVYLGGCHKLENSRRACFIGLGVQKILWDGEGCLIQRESGRVSVGTPLPSKGGPHRFEKSWQLHESLLARLAPRFCFHDLILSVSELRRIGTGLWMVSPFTGQRADH